MTATSMDAAKYGDDLAYIHDQGYSSDAVCAARCLVALLRKRALRNGTLLDLGCGSGHSTEFLATSGYEVLGLDVSPAMIRLAKRRVPTAAFRVRAFSSNSLRPCVGILAAGEVFNYLTSPPALRRLFKRAFELLAPGGLLLCDLRCAPRAGAPRTWVNSRTGTDWAVLAATCVDRRGLHLVRTITSLRLVQGRWRRRQAIHRQRLYPVADVERWLSAVGFQVQVRRGYGERHRLVDGSVIIARKSPGIST